MKKDFYFLFLLFFYNLTYCQLYTHITLTKNEENLFQSISFDKLYNIGRHYKVTGYPHLALPFLKAALFKKPHYAPINWDLGDIYLILGDYPMGLLGFKHRWIHTQLYQEKLWQKESLDGKTIMVYCQWGLGDTFMYVRYITLLKKLGATTICCCQRPLQKILSLCPYIDFCISDENSYKSFDYQVPITYLPELFETTVDTIPNEVPYITADPFLVKKWYDALSNDKNFKIGICWQGSMQGDEQMHLRSVPLNLFSPLFEIPNVSIYSLQQKDGIDQIAQLDKKYILHQFNAAFDKSAGPFMDTAAVIQNLDLIISIDTSIAHLAAAMGKPVWVLLPFANEWRYLLTRTDSPWYPTMQLFRQQEDLDWNHVINNVCSNLSQIILERNI